MASQANAYFCGSGFQRVTKPGPAKVFPMKTLFELLSGGIFDAH
jgi:hypothetical protein